MAITIPAAGGDFIDIASDSSLVPKSAFRSLTRFLTPEGVFDERVQIVGDRFMHKGGEYRVFGTTLSSRAALENVASVIPQIVLEQKAKGFNSIRLHHDDQTSADGGLLKDAPTSYWYELDPTESGRYASTIKWIRRLGMTYTLDLNASYDNTTALFTRIIKGANAAEIFGISWEGSTVNGAASSTTQTLVDVGDLEPGCGLWFGTTGAFRSVVSVNTGANTVVLDATISTTDTEEVYLAVGGFKLLPPINTAASDQLKGATLAKLGQDVSVGSEVGMTIGLDNHLLYLTVTNEHLPNYALNARQQKLFDLHFGYQWAYTSPAARRDYAIACRDWLLDDFKPWLASQGWGHIPIAWGSEFWRTYPEIDILLSAVDVVPVHEYRDVYGLVGQTLNPNPPSIQGGSIDQLVRPLTTTGKPVILEEYNSSYPNRFRAEIVPAAATWARRHRIAGMYLFDSADGSYNQATPPHSRQYQVQGDRCRDDCILAGAHIFLRGDLYPKDVETTVNRMVENVANQYWGTDTPNTIFFAGHQAATATFQRGQSITIGTGHRGVCFVTSMDPRKPIWESPRLIVGHVTDQVRRNVVFNDDYTQMTNAGSGNSSVRHGAATISFYHDFPSKLTIYRLAHAGARGSTVTPSISGNLVTLSLAIDASNDTFLYEVVGAGF